MDGRTLFDSLLSIAPFAALAAVLVSRNLLALLFFILAPFLLCKLPQKQRGKPSFNLYRSCMKVFCRLFPNRSSRTLGEPACGYSVHFDDDSTTGWSASHLYAVHPHGALMAPLQMMNPPVHAPINGPVHIFTASSSYVIFPLNWIAYFCDFVHSATRKEMKRWVGKVPTLVMPGGVLEAVVGSAFDYNAAPCGADSSNGKPRLEGNETISLINSHRGFLQLAIENNVKVVPCFAFGLDRQHSHSFPRLTYWMYRIFRIPLPGICLNRFGIPGRNQLEPVRLVVGRPICPSAFTCASDLGNEFYGQLQELFDKHKLHDHRYQRMKIRWHTEPPQMRGMKIMCIPLLYAALTVLSLIVSGEYFSYQTVHLWLVRSRSEHLCRETVVHVHAVASTVMWILGFVCFQFAPAGSSSATVTSQANSKMIHKYLGYLFFANIFLLVLPSAYWMLANSHAAVWQPLVFCAHFGLCNEMTFHSILALYQIAVKRNVSLHSLHVSWVLSSSRMIL